MRTIRISIIVIILLFLAPAAVVQAGAPLLQTGNGNTVYLPIISNQRTDVTLLGPFGGRAVALAIDPTNVNYVYEGTRGRGILVLTDGCQSVAESNAGLAKVLVDKLVTRIADACRQTAQ